MPLFPSTKQRNYTKSNKILTVPFYISNGAKSLARDILNSADTDVRQKLSSTLLKELSLLADIPPPQVKISDAQQYHKKRGGKITFRQYGYYRPDTQYIYITNRTAARGQHLAPKTFLDTLLHEWLHHYDSLALKLDSIHTAGFYARLKDVKGKLGYFDPT